MMNNEEIFLYANFKEISICFKIKKKNQTYFFKKSIEIK